MTTDNSDTVDLGQLARWSTSSHKYGYSLDNLRDGDDNTFWQSEGPQPHSIDLTFPKKVMVSSVHVNLSHPQDDSYTPSLISIQAGTGLHDLQEVRHEELDKPSGWIVFPLRPISVPLDREESTVGRDSENGGQKMKIIEGPPIPAYYIRIVILANHLNGKDTHVRGVRIFGLASPTTSLSATEPIIKPSTLRPSIVPPNADSRPTVAPISLRAASKRPARPREPAVAAAAAASPPSSPGEEDENGVKPLRPEWVKGLQALEAGNDVSRGFTTVEFRQFESIR